MLRGGHRKGQHVCSTAAGLTGGVCVRSNKWGLLWGRRAREVEGVGGVEGNVITGGKAALFVEKMVFICLENLGYTLARLTEIWSVDENYRMGENQF